MALCPVLPSVLHACPDLQALSDHEIQYLSDRAQVMILDAGDFLCQEGDLADVVWILVMGQVVFQTPDKPQASYASLFGEAGLLTDIPPTRRVGIQATKTSVVVSIPVIAFTIDEIAPKLRPILAERQAHYLAALPEAQVEDIFDMLRCCSELSDLQDEYIRHLAKQAEIVEFEQGQTILCQGDPAQYVYVIIEGEVEYSDLGKSISAAGTIFGENGLLVEDDPRRRVDATAKTKVVVLRLLNEAFTPEIRAAMVNNLEMLESFYEIPGEGSSTP